MVCFLICALICGQDAKIDNANIHLKYAIILEGILQIDSPEILIDYEASIIELIDVTKKGFGLDYASDLFELLLSDIGKLKKCEKTKRQEIFKKAKYLIGLEPSKSNIEKIDNEPLLNSTLKDVTEFYGKKSFYTYTSANHVIKCKIYRKKFKGIYDDIKAYENDYAGLFKKTNPENIRPLSLYCLYYEATKDWDKCLEYSEKIYKLLLNFNVGHEVHLSPYSFLVFLYAKKGQFNKAFEIFKKIPEKFTDEFHEELAMRQYRIFSGMADVWENKGNPKNSIIYQELALLAISASYDVSDSEVIDEAKKLRDKYEKAGEWKSLRNLEERHKLKPFPKNPAEK